MKRKECGRPSDKDERSVHELLKHVLSAVFTWNNFDFMNETFNSGLLSICTISAFSNSNGF